MFLDLSRTHISHFSDLKGKGEMCLNLADYHPSADSTDVQGQETSPDPNLTKFQIDFDVLNNASVEQMIARLAFGPFVVGNLLEF